MAETPFLKPPRAVYTTGQIARLLRVAPRTVSQWIDKGHLKGYRLPGSQDRRVLRTHLIVFLANREMPPLEDFEALGAEAPS